MKITLKSLNFEYVTCGFTVVLYVFLYMFPRNFECSTLSLGRGKIEGKKRKEKSTKLLLCFRGVPEHL